MSSFHFSTALPWWLTLPGLLIAALLVWWYYRRETRVVGGWATWVLPTLRTVAVVVVLLTFLSPVVHWRWIEGQLGRVVFVVDNSSSMQVPDVQQMPRIEAVHELLFGGNAAVVEQLRDTHSLRVVTGGGNGDRDEEGSGLQTVWSQLDPADDSASDDRSPDPLIATGMTTDLATMLRQAGDFFDDLSATKNGNEAGKPHDAVVLLSDGRHNESGTPTTAARRLAMMNVPVYAVATGQAEEPTDVAVVRVDVPDRIFFRNRLRGSLVVKESLPEDQSYRLRILDGETGLWEETVTASSPGVREIAFEVDIEQATKRQADGSVPPASTGPSSAIPERAAVGLSLRVEIETDAAEVDLVNNRHQIAIWSITQQTRLLIVDGRSRWETRYLRNLFDRDPQWEVDATIAGSASEAKEIATTLGPGGFPDELAQLSQYDAIVLGEVPPGLLNATQLETLEQFVARGGGLVIVDGTRGHLRRQLDGPLGTLVPVKYGRTDPVTAEAFRLNAHGPNRTVIELDEDAQENQSIWSELIPPRSMVAGEALPGAEVLIAAETESGRFPWLVMRRYGGGRVAYLAADESWRWRMEVADLHHGRFWNQLLRGVMAPLYPVSDAFIDLDSGPRSRQAGEQAEIRVRLRDAEGRPQPDALVDAVLTREGESFATVGLSAADPALGTYDGLTPPLPPGDYRVQVRASGYAQDAIDAQSQILVQSRTSQETLFQAADPQLMQAIADASGGQMLSFDEADTLAELLEPLSSGRVVESQIALWQTFPWFLVIIALLTLEWLLRKMAGLV